MNQNSTFNEKFNALGEYYVIEKPNEIKDFLKDNEKIFVLLEEVKPYLNQYFINENYNLEMVYDPECGDEDHLVLRIYVSRERFRNGVSEDIEHIREMLRPFRRKYQVLSEFAVRAGVKNV
ncbi:hypothetical protein [Methanobrevibacter sp.]|uniref:hypothetical protein n=1 Tax=Methanobrevibacter sp. TaxID=66852 RepID=UPI0025D6504E|nr:hypothetical protein [Methanobrevibacter sp.]MBQ6512239.1 hypothetical protein [Methanobrevibacter sp.]